MTDGLTLFDNLNDIPVRAPAIITNDDSARARYFDPLPSHQAADSNTNRTEVEAKVYSLLSVRPMTDAELTTAYFAAPGAPAAHYDSPRKRRSDLTGKGIVVATNLTRPSPSGRHATVWGLAPSNGETR
ncbi:hypothetical protein [Frigoribacterium sp. UYMn621]|uniref:hypothetical protein n=1 Tax=Frigoribacterium sp. UYMn621 TaxID=3156343 RepID=UPI00339223DC